MKDANMKRRVIALALAAALWPASAMSQGAASAPAATSTQGELATRIAAGTLSDLRWPNFTDYRADVKRFYDAGSNSPAWIQNGQPRPQALAMIELFKQASRKGLNPDDYDTALWDARMAKLQPAGTPPADTDLAHIDLAMT